MNDDKKERIKSLVEERVGRFLRTNRVNRGITVEGLALALKCSQSVVERHETGNVPVCDLVRVAEFFEIPALEVHQFVDELQREIYLIRQSDS